MKDYEGYKVPFMTEKIFCLFLFYEVGSKEENLIFEAKVFRSNTSYD